MDVALVVLILGEVGEVDEVGVLRPQSPGRSTRGVVANTTAATALSTALFAANAAPEPTHIAERTVFTVRIYPVTLIVVLGLSGFSKKRLGNLVGKFGWKDTLRIIKCPLRFLKYLKGYFNGYFIPCR